MRKGNNGCVRAMVSGRPSQNQKRKARADNTGGSKTVCNCTKDDLDTGEWLPINTFLSFLPLSISFFATCLSATCHLPAPRHVLLTPPQYVRRQGCGLGIQPLYLPRQASCLSLLASRQYAWPRPII